MRPGEGMHPNRACRQRDRITAQSPGSSRISPTESHHETYLSAFQDPPQTHPWFSGAHAHRRRPRRDQRPPREGSQALGGLSFAIPGRAACFWRIQGSGTMPAAAVPAHDEGCLNPGKCSWALLFAARQWRPRGVRSRGAVWIAVRSPDRDLAESNDPSLGKVDAS